MDKATRDANFEKLKAILEGRKETNVAVLTRAGKMHFFAPMTDVVCHRAVVIPTETGWAWEVYPESHDTPALGSGEAATLEAAVDEVFSDRWLS